MITCAITTSAFGKLYIAGIPDLFSGKSFGKHPNTENPSPPPGNGSSVC